MIAKLNPAWKYLWSWTFSTPWAKPLITPLTFKNSSKLHFFYTSIITQAYYYSKKWRITLPLPSNQIALKKSQVILPCLTIANIYLQETYCRVTTVSVKHKYYQGLGTPRMPVEHKCLKNKKSWKQNLTFWAFLFCEASGSDLTLCTLQRTSNNSSLRLKSLYTTLPSSGAWYSEGSSLSSWSSLGSFPRENE